MVKKDKGVVRRIRKEDGEGDQDDVDEEALARLEALQRQRMMDMFGYDPDEEPAPKPEAPKPAKKEDESGSGGAADGRAKETKKQAKSVSAKQAGMGPISRGIQKDAMKKPLAVSSSKDGKVASRPQGLGAQGREQGDGAVIKQKRPAAAQGAPMPISSPKKLTKEEMERERKLFMSPNASRIHLTLGEDEARRLKEGPLMGRSRAREEENFGSFAKSVAELGTSAFWGRKKKKLEAEKLRSMGAKEPKKQSVPYNILMGQLSKEKEREGKRKLKQEQAGLAVKRLPKKGGTKKKSGTSFGATGVFQVNPKAGGGGGGGGGRGGGKGGKGWGGKGGGKGGGRR